MVIMALVACIINFTAGQAPHGGRAFARLGRFVYSDSFRTTSEPCTSDTSPCYDGNEQVISDPSSDGGHGFYTRLVFDLVANGHTQVAALAGLPTAVSVTVRYVASENADDTYAVFSIRCPPGAPCQGVEETTVTISLTGVRVTYPLRKMCFSAGGNSMGGQSSAHCAIPSAYLMLNNITTCQSNGGPFGPDCSASGATCLLGTSCREQVCDSSSFPLTPSETADALDQLCGVDRDIDTGFADALNTRCVEACCPECPTDNVTTAFSNQVWAIGPNVHAFQVLGPSRILCTATVTVTVASTGATRVTTLTDLDLGTVAMNDEGDQQVRVSVTGISSEVYANLPNLSGGAVLIADYSTPSTGYVRMGTDPAVNSYTLLPNNGRGLTPTARNLNSTFSIGYLNSTGLLGASPGYYGVSQGTLTSDLSKFTEPSSCSDGYFANREQVPGAQIKTGTADVPLVPVMCQITNKLNKATDQFLGGTIPPNEIEGREFMFPSESLTAPRYTVYDNTLNYFIPDGNVLVALGIDRGLPENNEANPGWVHQKDARGRAEQTFSVAVDVADSFMPYNGVTSSVEVSAGGCFYNWTSGAGNFRASIKNLSNTTSNTFNVDMSCTTSDTNALTAGPLTPAQFTLPIPPDSVMETVPLSQYALFNGTVPGDSPPNVVCTADVYDQDNAQFTLTTRPFKCMRMPDGSASYQAEFPPQSNATSIIRNGVCTMDSDGTPHCPPDDGGASQPNNVAAIVISAVAVGVVMAVIAAGLVCACICCCKKKGESPPKDISTDVMIQSEQ